MKTRKAKPVRLPHVPSQLIRIALKDLKSIERSPKFAIRMDDGWVIGTEETNTYCVVCFAGSVMVRTLKADTNQSTFPENFGVHNKKALFALNFLRNGKVQESLKILGYRVSDLIGEADITPYEDNPERFKLDMKKLANDLEILDC